LEAVGRLAGRALLVTGSTGIAAAAARRFAGEGARVFVTSRTAEHCAALASELALSGAEAGFLPADLTDEGQVEAAVAAAVARFGRLDGLFTVAAGSGRRFGDGPPRADPGGLGADDGPQRHDPGPRAAGRPAADARQAPTPAGSRARSS